MADDLIERAERFCATSMSQAARTIVPELVEALKDARQEIERLVRLLRCAKEGCDGDHTRPPPDRSGIAFGMTSQLGIKGEH